MLESNEILSELELLFFFYNIGRDENVQSESINRSFSVYEMAISYMIFPDSNYEMKSNHLIGFRFGNC